MSSGQTGWLVLFMMSLFLIVVGFQGDLGLLVGIIFCPQYIILQGEADYASN